MAALAEIAAAMKAEVEPAAPALAHRGAHPPTAMTPEVHSGHRISPLSKRLRSSAGSPCCWLVQNRHPMCLIFPPRAAHLSRARLRLEANRLRAAGEGPSRRQDRWPERGPGRTARPPSSRQEQRLQFRHPCPPRPPPLLPHPPPPRPRYACSGCAPRGRPDGTACPPVASRRRHMLKHTAQSHRRGARML